MQHQALLRLLSVLVDDWAREFGILERYVLLRGFLVHHSRDLAQMIARSVCALPYNFAAIVSN